MILVSGANGHFSGAVIENLKRLLPDKGRFAVGTRNPDSDYARKLAHEGIAVRRMDFNEPQSVEDALRNITKALFISTWDDNTVRFQQNLNAINGARAAGVRHVIYTSFINAVPESLAEHSQRVHAPTEKTIKESGLAYTILRHGLYAETLLGDLEQTLSSGKLQRGGGNARIAHISRDDLGVSAAHVLAGAGHENKVYSETAPEALSYGEIASAMSEVFGIPIVHQNFTPEEWFQHVHGNWGMPEAAARAYASTVRAFENNEFDIVSPDYEAITGKPARTIKQFFQDYSGK